MPITWKYLQSHPKEMDKLIRLIETFDAFTSSETDPRLKNFVERLVQLRDAPEQVNAEHIFNSIKDFFDVGLKLLLESGQFCRVGDLFQLAEIPHFPAVAQGDKKLAVGDIAEDTL